MGVTTKQIWDNSGNIVYEYGTKGATTYNRGLGGEIIKSARGGGGSQDRAGDNYYAYNGHGDTTNLLSKDKDSVNVAFNATYDYDAFGNLTENTGGEADNNPFRYNGQYTDDETGLLYLRNRYYDPTIGRFTQEDTYWNVNNMIYGDDRNDIVISYKHQENIRDEINDTIKFSNFILCNNVKLVSEKEIDTYINENYSVEKKLGTIKHSEQDEYICGSNRFNIYNINLVPNYNVICQSNNRYVYCNSNSIKYVDENGMFWGAAIIKIVDVIGGAILQYFVEGILIMEVYAPGYDD